jgi:phosphate uptake regulator/aminoglycoside phosphotransferase
MPIEGQALGSTTISNNLRFMVAEVDRQLERLGEFLAEPSPKAASTIRNRDDYIDNLKRSVERESYETLIDTARAGDKVAVTACRSAATIAVNLERIADRCLDVVAQVQYAGDNSYIVSLNFPKWIEPVRQALSRFERAAFAHDLGAAKAICKVESVLDRRYEDFISQSIAVMECSEKVSQQLCAVLIANALERMGDAMLNLGEALMSLLLGENIKYRHYVGLARSLTNAGQIDAAEHMSMVGVRETRSGAQIRAVYDHERPFIIKQGNRQKLREEKRGVETWQHQAPGISPQIVGFDEIAGNASLLYEYLPGQTFDQVLLQGTEQELHDALARIEKTLLSVWRRTLRRPGNSSGFATQLGKRLPEVFSIHPEFRKPAAAIGDLAIPSVEDLVARAGEIEKRLEVPVSVLGHGDFNADNIILDAEDGRVRFIDLHRASAADYVQDVSVFLVSNYRLQVFDKQTRKRITFVIRNFLEFAERFAEEVDDEAFTARLLLAVARSLATSARFILDEAFAGQMFMKARFLLEKFVLQKSARDIDTKLVSVVLDA